ncbi:TPA: hypothetical protein I9Z33_002852 [Clostridium perfringens]|nr:hypothetical protein [Clostridium perfringens]HAT4097393.1 hypothetical protein [Clostridium perfringens]
MNKGDNFMELKDFMESCVCYLNLSREKQQYAAGLIRGLALAEQIEKDKQNKDKEQKIC